MQLPGLLGAKAIICSVLQTGAGGEASDRGRGQALGVGQVLVGNRQRDK